MQQSKYSTDFSQRLMEFGCAVVGQKLNILKVSIESGGSCPTWIDFLLVLCVGGFIVL